MNRTLLTIIISVCFLFSKGQVKDYFIPTSEYFNETFLFQSEKWENEDGQFQVKNKVTYYQDPTGNYKKYIENSSYRYNVPQMSLKVHQFYYVGEEKVASIYFYIEGVSEELDQMGLNTRDKNQIILKYPSATWTDNTDPDVTEYYKSEFGKLTTDYGEYNNCIIVTKTSKAKTQNCKRAEKYSYKHYYAYKIGLVKTETFENGKLLKMEMGYGGTLVDNFSEYSYYQMKKEDAERLEIERKKKEEEGKLKAFLEERENTIYDYKSVEPDEYLEIEKKINSEIQSIYQQENLKNISFSIHAVFTTDTLFRNSNKLDVIGLDDNELKNKILTFLNSISIKPTYLNNYSVNSKAEYKFEFSQSTNTLSINKNDDELLLRQGNSDIFNKHKSLLSRDIRNNPNGKYQIKLDIIENNNEELKQIEYLDYKNYGGPTSAFLSILVPGTGDYLVNGGKGSMLGNAHPIITTIGVYGFIGSGVYFKSQSNKNYNFYHKAINQEDINKYYDLANSQNKTAWTLIGLGGVVWIADIYWVIKTGANNKRVEKETRKKLNIVFVPSFNNSYSFALTYKF